MSFTLPHYINAGAYKRAIDIYHNKLKLKVPESPGKIRNEGQMCYVLAQHQLGTDWDEEVTNKALMKCYDHLPGVSPPE